ncbi:MAG: DUF2076 domain-containing protein [Variibacter sp.]
MTPEERDLIVDLFDRLAQLERNPRDPEAERAIREGMQRAPNAIYALVQSVLVQDEALRAANDHIAELEDELDRLAPPQGQRGNEKPKSFLEGVRDTVFGREEPRGGSVPSVGRGQPMGAPAGYGEQRGSPWGSGARDAGPGYGGPGGPSGGPGGPGYGAPPQGGGGGGFLGTAAAVAAGAIGGSLLMNGIRSAMAGQGGGQHSPLGGALDHLSRGGAGKSDPNSSLAQDAGIGDIGRGGGRNAQAAADRQQDEDQDQDDQQDEDYDQDEEQDGDYDDADFESDDDMDDT